MKKLFGSIIDVRKGEILLTVLMIVNYYLLLVTYYFLKPARDSLFLVKVDPTQLPIVFIITAIITVPVVSLQNRLSQKLRLHVLIAATSGFLITNLGILRLLIQWDDPWVYYLFYTWVSIYGALTTSQFWLLANSVYNATQAKRIFVLLGLGGIIGAFTGGEVTGLIVTYLHISTPDLLFICMAILAVTIILTVITVRYNPITEQSTKSRKQPVKKESIAQLFGTIKKSRHLLLIVGIIAMTMMVASFVDYQFKVVSKGAFPTTEELTSFLGKFYGRLSLVSLFLQLLLTYRFLRILGVGGAIMFLPIALMLGSVSMLIAPGLFAAVLLRGADGSLKYSIDKTGRELLFLPVPLEVKKRTKVFIDLFVDRWFRGIAGGLLLLCTMVLDLSVRQISIVVIALIVFWFCLTCIMRKEYVNAFRKALEKRQIDLSSLNVNITDGQAIKTLMASLNSANEREVSYALYMLTGTKDKRLIEPVLKHISHKTAEVRRQAVRVLQTLATPDVASQMYDLLHDSDPQIRRDAISIICQHAGDKRSEILREFLTGGDFAICSAAVGCIARYGSDAEKELITEEIVTKLLKTDGSHSEACRIQLASAFGSIFRPNLKPTLTTLMDDHSPVVVREVIQSLGQLQDPGYVPWLLKQLRIRHYRSEARVALANYGESIFPTLRQYILDESISPIIRYNIARIFSSVPTQASVDTLSELLEQVPSYLSYFIIKALNKLRANHSELKFTHDAINRVLVNETKTYYEVLRILQLHRNSDTPSGRLLARALIEKQDQNLEHIFRLLGLSYPPQDIYNAYLGLTSHRSVLRANAVEFLDNVLLGEAKRMLAPILDDVGTEFAAKRGEELFNFHLESTEQGVALLIDGDDIWLKCCAMYHAGTMASQQLRDKITQATEHPHQLVKETAELALRIVDDFQNRKEME
ncbi:MAG: Npt1/Npt2 family nucleotide transporter [Candidatus Zixiibacteriota bacterium]